MERGNWGIVIISNLLIIEPGHRDTLIISNLFVSELGKHLYYLKSIFLLQDHANRSRIFLGYCGDMATTEVPIMLIESVEWSLRGLRNTNSKCKETKFRSQLGKSLKF